MGHAVWHTEPNRALTAEVEGFRLLVEVPTNVDGSARFLVIRKENGKHRHGLIRSGYSENVRVAMETAERLADRSA
jgi:hypothetical protein